MLLDKTGLVRSTILRSFLPGLLQFLWLFLAGPILAVQKSEGLKDDDQVRIDSVIIITEDVFDLTSPKTSGFLFRLANDAHIVTRKSIIRREILLDRGDLYDTARVNESIRNLRRIPYLFKTDIRLETDSLNRHLLVVNTSDRWSTTGGVSLHRSGGISDWQIGFEEDNLFGYGLFTSHHYFLLGDDRGFYQVRVREPRFLGKKLAVETFYSDNPRAGQWQFSLERPYYTLNQKTGARLAFEYSRSRIDYYLSQILSGRDRFKSSRLSAEFTYRVGPPHLKHYGLFQYEYIDRRFRGRSLETNPQWGLDSATIEALLPGLPCDSLFHYAQAAYRLQQVNYHTYERLNRFHKAEDINLGFDGRLIAGLAVGPRHEKYRFYTYALWAEWTGQVGRTLSFLGCQAREWRLPNNLIYKELLGYIKVYHQYGRIFTLVIGGTYTAFDRGGGTHILYLDEARGIRGYPAYFSVGGRRLVFNAENRVFSDLELLSVGIGGVLFADIGNIWSKGTVPKMADCAYSVGGGLRFGVSRSTQAEIVRIDLAYAPRLRHWQISVGTGQFF